MNLNNRLSKLERRGKPAPKIVVIFPDDSPEQTTAKQQAANRAKNGVIIRVKQDRK